MPYCLRITPESHSYHTRVTPVVNFTRTLHELAAKGHEALTACSRTCRPPKPNPARTGRADRIKNDRISAAEAYLLKTKKLKTINHYLAYQVCNLLPELSFIRIKYE